MGKSVVSQVSRGQGNEFLNKLEAAGLNSDLAQKVVDSKGNALATMVVNLIRGKHSNWTSQERAREIMGRNFFGREHAQEYFGVDPWEDNMDVAFGDVPFTETTLVACKDTHVLVAVFPLSIISIIEILSKARLFYDPQSWHNKYAFENDRGEAGWHLVRKTPVEDSADKSWREQQALLCKNEETPSAQVMAYTIAGHYLATGERLFKHFAARCADVVSGGNHRVVIGGFGSDSGKLVDIDWDGGQRLDFVGVSAARKPDA
ncbi:MAG: hypothetical protein Q7S28_03415 [bacterium]|nr:hypothetical protein [bacterium]